MARNDQPQSQTFMESITSYWANIKLWISRGHNSQQSGAHCVAVYQKAYEESSEKKLNIILTMLTCIVSQLATEVKKVQEQDRIVSANAAWYQKEFECLKKDYEELQRTNFELQKINGSKMVAAAIRRGDISMQDRTQLEVDVPCYIEQYMSDIAAFESKKSPEGNIPLDTINRKKDMTKVFHELYRSAVKVLGKKVQEFALSERKFSQTSSVFSKLDQMPLGKLHQMKDVVARYHSPDSYSGGTQVDWELYQTVMDAKGSMLDLKRDETASEIQEHLSKKFNDKLCGKHMPWYGARLHVSVHGEEPSSDFHDYSNQGGPMPEGSPMDVDPEPSVPSDFITRTADIIIRMLFSPNPLVPSIDMRKYDGNYVMVESDDMPPGKRSKDLQGMKVKLYISPTILAPSVRERKINVLIKGSVLVE